MICGDFNNFDTTVLSEDFNLSNKVTCPTRLNNILDHIWIDEELSLLYESTACIGPPLSTSDHNCIILHPTVLAKPPCSGHVVEVWDYRQSFVAEFMRTLSSLDFDVIHNCNFVNDKLQIFYELLTFAATCFPRENVIFTNRDKPWVTPMLKSLINKRWMASEIRISLFMNIINIKLKPRFIKLN